jgi:MFS superfamily sulfate permease-like transporter
LISFILGFFRLGFIDVVLSRALLRGFVTAVAFIILMLVHPIMCRVTHLTHCSYSEQLIPMLGLVALEHKLNPQTTLEKILFLVEYGFTRSHRPTAFISAIALAALVMLRMLKASLRRYKWVARVPEVLIVVIVSTSTSQCPGNCLIYSLMFAVLSDEFRWDDDGIAILGDVPIHTGGRFIKFPLHHHNLPYLRQTTSTAV